MATPGPRAPARVARFLVAVLAILASGCSHETRVRIVAFLFEDAPSSGDSAGPAPVVRSPRHPLPPTPTPTVPAPIALSDRQVALDSWDDVLRLLPKDRVGNPDWDAALAEKFIAPRPGIGPEATDQAPLSLDIAIVAKSDPAFTVTFSHQQHGAWLTCANCHSGMFEMKAGATPMTPLEVHTTRYCAACHGTVAFDTATGCPLCHLRQLPQDLTNRVDWNRALEQKLIAPRPGLAANAPDQPVLDLDVTLEPKGQPTFKTIFSHSVHTRWLACANCHPGRFPMETRELTEHTAEWHSRQYCGACHGNVSFGSVSTCGPCHPALAKARQHQDVLDLDVAISPKTPSASPTTFSHKTHRWVECPSCHGNLFDATGGMAQLPAAEIYGGKYCAGCHGAVAKDLITRCRHCHSAEGAS